MEAMLLKALWDNGSLQRNCTNIVPFSLKLALPEYGLIFLEQLEIQPKRNKKKTAGQHSAPQVGKRQARRMFLGQPKNDANVVWAIWEDVANSKGVMKVDFEGSVAKVFQVASDLVKRGHLCDTMFLEETDMRRAWTIFLEQVRGAFGRKRWPRILHKCRFRQFFYAILQAVWRFLQHDLAKKLSGMETRQNCAFGPIVSFARQFLDDANEARSPWDLVDASEEDENSDDDNDDGAWGGTLLGEYGRSDEEEDCDDEEGTNDGGEKNYEENADGVDKQGDDENDDGDGDMTEGIDEGMATLTIR